MIGLYFNETGYYIQGNRIEAAWSCYPACTETGTPLLSPTHHLYGVLYRALRQLEEFTTMEDVVVYNDSRLIEEINGVVIPLDDTHARWLEIIRRRTLPQLRSHVLFRKKSTRFVTQYVEAGQKSLIGSVDPKTRLDIMQKENDREEERKKNTLQRFKRNWNNGNTKK